MSLIGNIHGRATKPPKPREQIGILVEYYTSQSFGQYLGNEVRPVGALTQQFGTAHAEDIKIEKDMVIKKSFSKTATIKAGTTVTRVCCPLEGREIE